MCQLLAYDWCTDNSTTDIGPIISRVVKLGKPYLGYNLVLVHSSTKFQLEILKFSEVIQFERSNRFSTNSIPKVLDRYIIFVCNFKMITQILRNLELPQTLFEKVESPWNLRLGVNLHENRQDWTGVTASLLYQIST